MLQKEPGIDFGQDAPDLLRNYLVQGILLLMLERCLRPIIKHTRGARLILTLLRSGFLSVGVYFLLRGVVMIWSNRVSKLQAADDLLDGLHLQGHETVLDVGCGRGLLLIKAAQQLPHGHVIGVDLWSNVDQLSNSKQATLQNAKIAGVAERVEVHDGDMCHLHFLSDGSVDAVVASKAIHNVPARAGRRLAIEEIVRVLKDGGQVAILDIRCIEEFAEDLQACGIHEIHVSTSRRFAYPRLRTVTGKKGAPEAYA